MTDQQSAQPVEIMDYAIASHVPLDSGALEAIKRTTIRRMRRLERRRDPRAASFLPEAWPFRDHRSLADTDSHPGETRQ